MKYRILIRVHSVRRDAAPLVLFQKILERMGASVLVVNGSSFPKALQFWKPHAAITGTFDHAARAKRQNPSCLSVLFDQEGFMNPGASHAERMAENPETYDALDLGLIWGQQILNEFDEFAPGLDKKKLFIIGNPKLDLARFLPQRVKVKDEKKTVGVVGRFPGINHYLGNMITKQLPNPGNIERTFVQAKVFVELIHALRMVLERTDYHISLRPHPQEQIESYLEYIPFWFGRENTDRFTVDDSIDFSSWATKQHVLISPSSTSFVEAYLLGVPTINLDKLSDAYEFNREYAPVIADWQDGALMPETKEQLCQLLEKGVPAPKQNMAMEEQLLDYCDLQSDQPACFRAAKLVMQFLEKSKPQFKNHWPKSLVNLRNEISFRRSMKANPLHHNFSYDRSHHDIPSHFDEMADAIVLNAENVMEPDETSTGTT